MRLGISAHDSEWTDQRVVGYLTYDGPPYMGPANLLFTVGNQSDKPVQLTGFSLPLKDGKNVVFPHIEGERTLPCPVNPGVSLKFWVTLSDIQEILRVDKYPNPAKIHVIARDGLDREYNSNDLEVKLDPQAYA